MDAIILAQLADGRNFAAVIGNSEPTAVHHAPVSQANIHNGGGDFAGQFGRAVVQRNVERRLERRKHDNDLTQLDRLPVWRAEVGVLPRMLALIKLRRSYLSIVGKKPLHCRKHCAKIRSRVHQPPHLSQKL